METEVHVYGFSIAANVLLSFFPFLLVMVSACRYVLQWPEAEQAIYIAINDYFAGETGAFLARNLKASADAHGRLEWLSIALLLFTANNIFMPLEVALNRAFGVTANRSFVMNQVVSTGLIFVCGGIALLSAIFTGMNQQFVGALLGSDSGTVKLAGTILFKIASIPLTIFTLLLVYWLLPNTKVSPRHILPGAIVVGLVLEALKWLNLLTWSWLYAKFEHEYGPFKNTITILMWSFMAGMVVLAGADWAARKAKTAQEAELVEQQPLLPDGWTDQKL